MMNPDDIVRELRLTKDYPHSTRLFDRAADVIESLRAQLTVQTKRANEWRAIAAEWQEKALESQRREQAAVEELNNAQPCFACAGFSRNGGKCFGAGTCRVRDIAALEGLEYRDLAYGESWRWRGPQET